MRRIRVATLRAGLVGAVLSVMGVGLAGVAPAGAAYPPPTLINTACSFSQLIELGQSATVTPTCTFAPGTTITVTFNGAPYLTAIASASGIYTESFATVADPSISLNGGTSEATTIQAVTTWVASGTNTSGGTNIATTLVSLASPSATAGSSSTSGTLAFTGADLAATVVAGIALLVMGGLLLWYARRRARPAVPSVIS